MNTLSRAEAQRRADEVRIFRDELARLEAEQVVALTGEQRAALTAHHDGLLAQYGRSFDIDQDKRTKQLSLGMRIASFLGALALAASVFFLFRQYWGLFSTGAQIGLLVAASFGSLLATFLVSDRDSTGYFAKLAAMVAFACFVLNITLLGQIFNITPSDKALLSWSALALVLAYALDLRVLLAAAILCLIAFISARTGTWQGMYWIDFGQRPENFMPAALLMFVVPSLWSHRQFSGFGPIYRVLALIALLIPILILANWGSISYLPWDPDTIERCYQAMGFAVCAAAIWLGARREWPEVVNTSLTFFVIFLYTKFYDWWWKLVPKFVFFLIIALTAILFILVMKRVRTAGLRTLGGGK
jgi:uncharacterized membrane protein